MSANTKPKKNSSGYRVIIRQCHDYQADKIAGILKEGMEELGFVPKGNIMLKPNVVLAKPVIFTHAFTRKEILEGMIIATKSRAKNIKELSVGERSGITIPTRYCFKRAGYPGILKKHRTKAYYFDECRHLPVRLKKPQRLRDVIYFPEPVLECDSLISLPKFKAHPWTKFTGSLKNHIGLQDDRFRLVDHNSFLEHKIVDLQEVIQPSFIAIDAIIAGQHMMLTPIPFPLGAIIMGTNSCAVDTVCCHMVHLNPELVIHLRLASERGYGPIDLNDIEISGDLDLENIREKTKKFKFCLEQVDQYFNNTSSNLSCLVGSFPENHSRQYCWGGCPGALQEAMHIFRGYYPGIDQKMKKIRYVVGKWEKSLDLAKDEKVIFVGDCTSWQGTLDNKDINIRARYKQGIQKNYKTKSNDMLLKMLKSFWHCLKNRSSGYLRAPGCPVSVAEHVNYLSFMGKMKNPNFDSRNVVAVNIAYWQMRFYRCFNGILNWFKSNRKLKS